MSFMHYARYEQGEMVEEVFLCDSCNENDDIELELEFEGEWVCLGVTSAEACSICGEDGM